jgi:hypothetical protein
MTDTTESESWESTGRGLLATELEDAGRRVGCTSADATDAIHAGDGPTAEQVEEIRRAITEIQYLVEEYVAPLADDVEPWDGAVDRVPIGEINDALGR